MFNISVGRGCRDKSYLRYFYLAAFESEVCLRKGYPSMRVSVKSARMEETGTLEDDIELLMTGSNCSKK